MAEGKIKQQSNTVLTGTVSKSVAYHTNETVAVIPVPDGQWLVISSMYLNSAGTEVYNHGLGNLIVRTSERNGGGSLNARVVTGPINLELKCFHYVSDGCTVSVNWYAIKLL